MMLIQPNGDMSAKIRQELREPESMDAIEKDVLAIREWLARQPHLPKDMGNEKFMMHHCQWLYNGFVFIMIWTDDQRLKTFLRGCKFSLEKVKKKLDMYYTMRNAVPEFFANRDVSKPELKSLFDIV